MDIVSLRPETVLLKHKIHRFYVLQQVFFQVTHSALITIGAYRIFTEPTDCSQSHSCSEVGSQSIVSKCPNGRIFDSKSKLCVPRSVNNQRICRKISCNNVKNDFLVFPANPAFYAYCFTSATGVHHTYMYKCDDEINKVFDVDTKKCRFNCKSRGYYSDPFDCSSYYICNGLKFASRHVHCPPNYFFNGTVCLNSMAHCPVGSILNMTSSTPIPIANMSLAADEISHTSEPMTEEVTDATTLSFSESTVIETSTTYELTTMHTVPMTMQTVDSQMATPTRKPSGAIWKHMGLLSVRVGRFLNII